MAKKKLYKSKTNFTLKRMHQSGSYGHIYERDYATIPGTSLVPEGQIPIYGGPTFKMSVRAGLNTQKKYQQKTWVSNPNSCGSSSFWTLGCMPEPNRNDSKIVLKPNAKRLTDFACYGSSYELIRASLTDIISRFPAEMYITKTTLLESGLLNNNIPDNSPLFVASSYYIVDNPMRIDIMQNSIPEGSIFSPLRYFCKSYKNYVIKKANSEDEKLTSWKVESEEDKGCLIDGDLLAKVTINNITIHCYYYKGGVLYLSPSHAEYSIRPNAQEIDAFFDSLDDFEKTLLNRDNNYCAIFETYKETEDSGWVHTEQKYQWPTSKGRWNIAIEGMEYSTYANSLTELAYGYDELFTNAIWKNMTHEAINNMDLTFDRNNEEVTSDSSKVKQLLNIIGRQFDEIKKYADTIKRTNTITYSQDGNTPDYFLPDNLELSGWEVKNILSTFPDNTLTSPVYSSQSRGYKASDANNEFMRRLKLNSKNILAKKGTKQAIEDLLSIFGYQSTDWLRRYYNNNIPVEQFKKAYTIIEYVYVADGYILDEDPDVFLNEVRRINALKDNFFNEGLESDEPFDYFQGLPVAEVSIEDKTRLIPWFDRYKEHDTKMYFQMKGGWSRNDGDGVNDVSKYEQTISKTRLAATLDELYKLQYYTLDETCLYYVISENEYYKIKDINKHHLSDGWEIASSEEIEAAESIINNNKGNNPHSGEYDNGMSYLESYGMLFKDASFENTRDDEVGDSLNYGFNISRQADSTKCLFFGNGYLDSEIALRGQNRIIPHNFFGGETYAEESSLSIINSKELHIVFDDTYREFIEEDILFYLKQIIPSTTIFSYSFEHIDNNSEKIYKARTNKVICDGDTCPIYGIVQ